MARATPSDRRAEDAQRDHEAGDDDQERADGIAVRGCCHAADHAEHCHDCTKAPSRRTPYTGRWEERGAGAARGKNASEPRSR